MFYRLCYYSCPIFSPLYSPSSLHPPPTSIPAPPLSSCPWIIHISSLASPFSILFLTSPCLFSTYRLCYLFSVPSIPLSPSHSPVDNPPCDLHSCDSLTGKPWKVPRRTHQISHVRHNTKSITHEYTPSETLLNCR